MTSEEKKKQPKHVCVVGAGASGLVSARELKKEGHSVVVFEQRHDIGGVWLYDPKVELEDPLGRIPPPKVHSSVYASLRLISPRETMGFTDFPFLPKKGRDTRRYPGHREVYLYLSDFCHCFGLREMIRFNTRVEYVGPVDVSKPGNDIKWAVKFKEENSAELVEEIFDAVVVANGHYSQPRLPKIRGMDTWRRKQVHSHIYRVPEPFRDEVVVVVGLSESGQEISLELAKISKAVHVSAKSLEISESLSRIFSKNQNLHLHPQIENLYEDGLVVFIDGSYAVADTIIYCTGYNYSFPFLDTKGLITVDDNRVGPLFEHTFPPSLAPSLTFVGIPTKSLPFRFFEVQANWIAQVLSGKVELPSFDAMMEAIEEFYNSRDMAGVPKHRTHDIADFEYCDKYGDYCWFPHVEEWRKDLFISAIQGLETNFETYRDVFDYGDEILEGSHGP